MAVFLVLLLLVQAASFTAIHFSITRNARESIAEELAVSERALQRLLAHNAAQLLDDAHLLAADDGFRSALVAGDQAKVVSTLAHHGARMNALVTAFLNTNWELSASTRPTLAGMAALVDHLAGQVHAGRTATAVKLVDGQPAQFVLIPIRAPDLLGWVLVGFRLDQPLATDLQSISGVHLAMLARPPGSPAWQYRFSTLPAAAARQLQAQMGDRLPSVTLRAGDDEYSVREVALTEPAGDVQAGAASVLLMRSVDETLKPYGELQWLLGGLTVLGLLAFAVGSIITARRVTTPIRRLAAAAERLAAGDYTTPVSGMRRDDEIGALAQRFEHMRRSIAQQQQEILELAYRDRLTGLPNRLRFRTTVDHHIRAEDGGRVRELAVVMLDLDRFKNVNELLGYRLGDLLLKGVAERLARHALHEGEMVARLGADEFALLLPGTSAEAARTLALRIARDFEAPLQLEEHTVDVGAGIGIACWPRHARDADALISRAELAMHAAKRRAQGPLTYSDSLDSAAGETLSLLSELRRAIEHGELRLYLQPKVGLRDGRVLGAEALVRWQHPRRGMLPPVQFVPFAEQTGFVRQITLWVFEEATRQWANLRAEGVAVRISVNLSTRDLLDPELPDILAERLVLQRVPTEAFCLEITESAIMDDPGRAEATLKRLDAMGFKLAIDDFGTGYSSLAYLKRLPVDELKIDKSFVMAMERDADDAKIVRSTIDLAHNLGLSVVAEGVENAAVWQQLQALHCDEAQGYHIGKPMPVDEFLAWCPQWARGQSAAAAFAA